MIQGIEKLLPASECDDFQAALYGFSDRCLRVRIDRKIEEIPFATDPIPWFDGGFRILDRQVRPGGCLHYAAADFYIQDAASLLPLRLLDARPDDRVLDLCASPGGKASAIAERLGPLGFLIANETIRARGDVLRHNLARTGRANYATSSLDPEALHPPCDLRFNKILLDVPCSGQTLVGTGKHDESAFRPQHVEHCARRGRRILRAAARMLAPGGTLVLSTCTFSPEENESQIEWLEQTFPSVWEPIEEPLLSAWQSPLRAGCYRLWPHRDRCRGGFAAALRKVKEISSSDDDATGPEPKRVRNRRASFDRRGSESRTDVHVWLEELGEWPMGHHVDGSTVSVAEPGIAEFLQRIESPHLYRGPTVATLVGRHWEPTHALALARRDWFVPCRVLPLDDAEAIAFMNGQSLVKGARTARSATGSPEVEWGQALWNHRPIGWLKESVNRWNNHLPAWGRMHITASSSDRGHA